MFHYDVLKEEIPALQLLAIGTCLEFNVQLRIDDEKHKVPPGLGYRF